MAPRDDWGERDAGWDQAPLSPPADAALPPLLAGEGCRPQAAGVRSIPRSTIPIPPPPPNPDMLNYPI